MKQMTQEEKIEYEQGFLSQKEMLGKKNINPNGILNSTFKKKMLPALKIEKVFTEE
jgi:hypothetical protein